MKGIKKITLSPFKTKTEVVYYFLKERILKGDFKPEEKIVISEVSRNLNVSDIPIAENNFGSVGQIQDASPCIHLFDRPLHPIPEGAQINIKGVEKR
jgi:hypothetical protein